MYEQKKSLKMLADVYKVAYKNKDFAFLVERAEDKIRLDFMIYDEKDVYITETVFEKERVEETFNEDIKEVGRLYEMTAKEFSEYLNN